MHSYYQEISTPTPSNWLSKILRGEGVSREQNVQEKYVVNLEYFPKGLEDSNLKPDQPFNVRGIYL